jgi:hypothetical protein
VQQQEKVAKLIEWFVKAALRHAEAIEAMQEKSAQVQAGELRRFYAAVKREDGVEMFLALLDHENPYVSGMAAVHAMREAPERCTALLVKLSELPGLIGFRARVALDRWEAGEWPEE